MSGSGTDEDSSGSGSGTDEDNRPGEKSSENRENSRRRSVPRRVWSFDERSGVDWVTGGLEARGSAPGTKGDEEVAAVSETSVGGNRFLVYLPRESLG